MYFYPRSPCGERRIVTGCFFLLFDISIHALLAESDGYLNMDYIMGLNFYPRSPCGERQNEAAAFYNAYDFYPRSPCGERLAEYGITPYLQCISIHALLAESDPSCTTHLSNRSSFLSTLSLRRATTLMKLSTATGNYFYPRSPCGERPARSAPVQRNTRISIHALLAESDSALWASWKYISIFLSTLSLRRATKSQYCTIPAYKISIHALLAESDTGCRCK